jgi:hypothetical protein
LGPNPHTAEFCNEGVGVRVLRKTETRVLHDFEHMPPSVSGLIVSPGIAEFVQFANSIRGYPDRDLVRKIPINLPLRNLAFASDHRRQKVKSKSRQNGPLTRGGGNVQPALSTRHSESRFPDGFACQYPECQPPNVRHHKRALTAAKVWWAQLRTAFKEVISTTSTVGVRKIVVDQPGGIDAPNL